MLDGRPIIAILLFLTAVSAGAPAHAGETPAAWIGVVVERAGSEGARVLAVVPGGPADRADVRAGDVLLALGGQVIGDGADVSAWLRAVAPGDEISFRSRRDGAELLGTMVAVARDERRRAIGTAPAGAPVAPAASSGAVDVGLFTIAIPPDLRRHLGAPDDEGVLLSAVVPGSTAESSGLRVGDVLVRASGRPVRSPGELYRALLTVPPRTTISLEVMRDGRTEILSFPVTGPRPVPASEGADEAAVSRLRSEIDGLRRRLAELERELAERESGSPER